MAVGEWVQGPDVDVLTAHSRQARVWYRWLIFTYGEDDFAERQTAAWDWLMESESSEFSKEQDPDDPELIPYDPPGTEEVNDPEGAVVSTQQSVGATLLSRLGYLELTAETPEPTPPPFDDPLVEPWPPPPPGVEVEWESEGGDFLSEWKFNVWVRPEGDLAGQSTQVRYSTGSGVMASGAYPYPDSGAWFRDWDFTFVSGPWSHVVLTLDGRQLTLVGAFKSQVNGTVPDATSAVYLERQNLNDYRPSFVTRTWRPPRYRFIFPDGMPTTRIRQTRIATLGGPPLRIRQHGGSQGGPPLRIRQTGI